MKQYANIVQKKVLLDSKDESLWKKWVDLKDRTKLDLVNLLKRDVKTSFKKNALKLLFFSYVDSNDECIRSIYWTNSYAFNSVIKEPFTFFHYLEKDLIDYSSDLVCYFAGKNKNCGYSDLEYFYNFCILSLLSFYTKKEKKGKDLFECFNFYGIMNSEFERNLMKIFQRDELSEEWKILFDRSVQKNLSNSKKESVRLYFSEFIKSYIRAISSYIGPRIVMKENFKGSKKLIRQQINFIMFVCEWSEDFFVDFYTSSKFLEFLEYFFKNSKLYYDFIKFLVFNNNLFILNTEMLDFAVSLLNKCKKNKNLKSCISELEKLIDDYCDRKSKKEIKELNLAKVKNVLRQEEEKLYNQMV